VALILPDLWVLFFVPLLLTFLTAGRLRGTVEKIIVGAIIVELVILAPLWLIFAEQDGNLLLLFPNSQLANAVDTVQRALYLAISVATAAVLAARWKVASGPGRRALLPSVAGAVCLLLFAALLAVDLVAGSRSQLLRWIAVCSLFAVPAAFLVGLLRSRLARGSLVNLFRGLRAMRPGDLQRALSRALGDPAFVILGRRPGTGGRRGWGCDNRTGEQAPAGRSRRPTGRAAGIP
jgi:hypothetical protein